MPKDRRDRSVSIDRYKTSPFPSSSSHEGLCSPKLCAETEENLKDWEEARCPVCMEHPHNAVLLICSSHEKGCRPFMCDTSYRHSNCLDQFRKSFAEISTATHQEHVFPSTQSSAVVSEGATGLLGTSENVTLFSSAVVSEGSSGSQERNEDTSHVISCGNQVDTKLLCPLCRGKINDWVVVEPARRFMNAKPRSCACETCNFVGNYSDLRKHARHEHPLARPSEADPERQRNWRRLERQRDLGDLLSTLQSFGEERGDDIISPTDDGGWLTVYFLIRVFRPRGARRSSSWSGSPGGRAQQNTRRRSTRLWGETYEGETASHPREDDESSDGGSGNWRRRIRRRLSPDNQP